MRVQRLRAPETGVVSYTVVGADGLPVEAVEAFLAYLAAVGRSPNTVAAYAYDLRDFLEWLGQVGRAVFVADAGAVAVGLGGRVGGAPRPVAPGGVFGGG